MEVIPAKLWVLLILLKEIPLNSYFVTGVTVISINYNNKYIGKTVNSFSSLSLNPPLVLFSLDKKSSSLSKFIKSKYIGINFLSKKQKKLSLHFAKKKSEWNNTKFFLSDNSVPMLENSLVNLECKLIRKSKAGDHIICVCKIISSNISNAKNPMIYFNNQYL